MFSTISSRRGLILAVRRRPHLRAIARVHVEDAALSLPAEASRAHRRRGRPPRWCSRTPSRRAHADQTWPRPARRSGMTPPPRTAATTAADVAAGRGAPADDVARGGRVHQIGGGGHGQRPVSSAVRRMAGRGHRHRGRRRSPTRVRLNERPARPSRRPPERTRTRAGVTRGGACLKGRPRRAGAAPRSSCMAGSDPPDGSPLSGRVVLRRGDQGSSTILPWVWRLAELTVRVADLIKPGMESARSVSRGFRRRRAR